MPISATDKELLTYFSQLNEPQKRLLIELMRNFLKTDHPVIDRASIGQYNKELDEAMERTGNGDYTTLEELEKEIKSW